MGGEAEGEESDTRLVAARKGCARGNRTLVRKTFKTSGTESHSYTGEPFHPDETEMELYKSNLSFLF